jgi:hypothetical protein
MLHVSIEGTVLEGGGAATLQRIDSKPAHQEAYDSEHFIYD